MFLISPSSSIKFIFGSLKNALIYSDIWNNVEKTRSRFTKYINLNILYSIKANTELIIAIFVLFHNYYSIYFAELGNNKEIAEWLCIRSNYKDI